MKEYKVEKVANAIIYFLQNRVEHFGKTKLMKLMFFADKMHLEKYGRTIFYDEYYKYERGPIAHLTLNILNSMNEIENDDLEAYTKKFRNYIELKTINDNGKDITSFESKIDFDDKIFSKSEIEVFNFIIEKYKSYSKEEISEASHKLYEYKNTKLNDKIEEINMIDSYEMKEYLRLIQDTNSHFDRLIS